MKITMPKTSLAEMLDFGFSQGQLLEYIAHHALDVINIRTDSGIDEDGHKFKPYASIRGVLDRDEKGNIIRDELGRWREHTVDRSSETVTLRSRRSIPEQRRMRTAYRVSPQKVAPDAKRVRIRFVGSRDGFGHEARANTAAGRNRGSRPRGRNNPRREFADLTDAEFAAICAEMRREGVSAFVAIRQHAVQMREFRKMQQAHWRRQKQLRAQRQRLARAKASKAESEAKARARMIREIRRELEQDRPDEG
jgi:hypothetical protein